MTGVQTCALPISDEDVLRSSQRTTRSETQLAAMRGKSQRKGILVGVWDEADVPAEFWSGYPGVDPAGKA